MENFVLYEDIGHGSNGVVYKGRRKGTINFVAINCIEKCKRHLITNMVRLIHDMSHTNVVKFYEWYETSNHLWMIVELCTGGSLKTVIEQDKHLPESCIRKFAIDLINGLHYIHSMGIIYCDLRPSNILLDGPEVLKFADFGMSRMEGEDIDALFQQFSEAGEQWSSSASSGHKKSARSNAPKGSEFYVAPELLQGAEPSVASDLWSFGCVLYEMFAGHPPFLAESSEQLKEKILKQPMLPLKARAGPSVASKPSAEFLSLLGCLLEKDPQRRIDWPALVVHPFWQGALKHITFGGDELRDTLRQSITSFTNSLGVDYRPQTAGHGRNLSTKDSVLADEDRPDTASSSYQPKMARGNTEQQVLFTLSSRPHTAVAPETPMEDFSLTSQQKSARPAASEGRHLADRGNNNSDLVDTSALVYHSSDLTVSPVIENAKKPGLMKYDHKVLSVPPYSAEKLASMAPEDREKQCANIVENLTVMERGPASQKHIQLLNYCGAICAVDQIADMLAKHGVLLALAHHIRDSQQVEVKAKQCQVVAAIACNVVELDPSVNLVEPLSILTELLRDGFRNGKIRLALMPAVGEMLFLVAAEDERRHGSSMAVPPHVYSLITRCLPDIQDTDLNLIAVKIIGNVATTTGTHSSKFATAEVGQLLWNIYDRSSNEKLRISVTSTLCKLCRHTPLIIQSILDKFGIKKMLTVISQPVSKIQQAAITMFVQLMVSDVGRIAQFMHDKEFLLHAIRLLDSPVVAIRAKSFLALQQIVLSSREMLLIACENRLMMYIERDSRKQAVNKSDGSSSTQYLSSCLEQLISSMVNVLPTIAKDILSSLEEVAGRKHPSSAQQKQLKACLPLTPILRYYVTSSVLRPRIICDSFMKTLSSLLCRLVELDASKGFAGIDNAEDFMHNMFILTESVTQHPGIVTEHSSIFIETILPSLAQLVFGSSGDASALSLRLFSDLSYIILTNEVFELAEHQTHIKKLHRIISETLLPRFEEILLHEDPLPAYGLKVLLCMLEQHPAFIRDLEKLSIIPVLFKVLENYEGKPVSSVVKQIVGILNYFVGRKEANMKELYDQGSRALTSQRPPSPDKVQLGSARDLQGLIQHISYLFRHINQLLIHNNDELADTKSSTVVMVLLLDTINGALKYVSEIVRRALEARKEGISVTHETEEAEELLMANKPLTELISPLTQLLTNDDADVADMSLKCLSLLVQLYGPETSTGLSPASMECYVRLLQIADSKKQKIILRIIKRMLIMDKRHIEVVRERGSSLMEIIRRLGRTASSTADVTLSTLAAEIRKIVDGTV